MSMAEGRRPANYELAREAINLIRYGPLFQNTDPAVPDYSREQVEAGMRRILAELEE